MEPVEKLPLAKQTESTNSVSSKRGRLTQQTIRFGVELDQQWVCLRWRPHLSHKAEAGSARKPQLCLKLLSGLAKNL